MVRFREGEAFLTGWRVRWHMNIESDEYWIILFVLPHGGRYRPRASWTNPVLVRAGWESQSATWDFDFRNISPVSLIGVSLVGQIQTVRFYYYFALRTRCDLSSIQAVQSLEVYFRIFKVWSLFSCAKMTSICASFDFRFDKSINVWNVTFRMSD